MDKNELMKLGDASVLRALADMFAILNGKGEILSSIGGDRMLFSPRLECDDGCSTILFGDEDEAKRAIEDILVPQDSEGEYHVFKFEPIYSDEIPFEDDGSVEIDIDAEGGAPVDIVKDGEASDKGSACDDGDDECELSAAIEEFKSKGDDRTVGFLEELKALKSKKTDDKEKKTDKNDKD